MIGGGYMKLQTGYLYHIKDSFFDKVKDMGIMINHENGHSRPSYLAVKDKKILWFIPLSSKIEKYEPIINKKMKKYGSCKGIMIRKILGRNQVILIQNAFPILPKYIKNQHMVDGKFVKISSAVQREIIDNFKYMLSLKEKGLNLFFTDIDSIKKLMLDEIEFINI